MNPQWVARLTYLASKKSMQLRYTGSCTCLETGKTTRVVDGARINYQWYKTMKARQSYLTCAASWWTDVWSTGFLRRRQMYRLNRHRKPLSGLIAELTAVAMHLPVKAQLGHRDNELPTRWKWVVRFMVWSFCHVGKGSWCPGAPEPVCIQWWPI
jgi:hypothetical protein